MTSPEKKPRQPRTPRSYESVLAGATALSLSQKVELIKILKGQVAAQVGDLQAQAKSATETVNGL